MTAFSNDGVHSYTCYLEEKKWWGWTSIKTVTYAVTESELGYIFTDLSTGTTYRFRLSSPDGEVYGSGSVSNYVHP